jgi:hypothetical protein
VEDSLHAFGELQVGDNSSQSLIFDPSNSQSCIKNGILTVEEIEEILAYRNLKSEIIGDRKYKKQRERKNEKRKEPSLYICNRGRCKIIVNFFVPQK